MRKILLSFVLGIFLTVSIAAGVESTMKPARPTSVIVKAFHGKWGIQDDVAAYILQQVKGGYIVKSVVLSEDEGWQRAVIVLEKY